MRIAPSLRVLFAAAALCCATPGSAAERTVTVSGRGEIQAEPDRATLSLGVEARNASMDAARGEVGRVVDALLKLTRDLKIDPKLVRTTRLTVQPEYNWNNQERERRLLGYWVQRQVEIDLRNLDQLGPLMERSVSLGANQVSPPQLDSSKRRDLEREALNQAMLDARANAEVAARAGGAKLGAVQTIIATDASSPPVPRPLMQRAQMVGAAVEQPETYSTGSLLFTASVQVIYALGDDIAK